MSPGRPSAQPPTWTLTLRYVLSAPRAPEPPIGAAAWPSPATPGVAQFRAICAPLRSELDPGDAGYYAARGQAYQATGRNDQALADFARATELDASYQPPTV